LPHESELSIEAIEPGAHAIKIRFRREQFTADVVLASENGNAGGLLIPHCPKEQPSDHRWIDTDPATHNEMVRGRNRQTGSKFARQIRILKSWNRYMRFQDQDERKPVSSFHITALALKALPGSISYPSSTAEFFDQAADLVRRPMPTPSGIGDPLVAKDPEYASDSFRRAAYLAHMAAEATEPEDTLRELFGHPTEHAALLRGAFSVGSGGALLAGLGAARPRQNPRAYGDGG
jgi:hypothetical protein